MQSKSHAGSADICVYTSPNLGCPVPNSGTDSVWDMAKEETPRIMTEKIVKMIFAVQLENAPHSVMVAGGSVIQRARMWISFFVVVC